jgi:hypothetical protein
LVVVAAYDRGIVSLQVIPLRRRVTARVAVGAPRMEENARCFREERA